MAVIKNNRFSADDDDTRQARLALLSENIDTYAAAIHVVGALLIWARAAFDAWVDLCATAAREDGDVDEATQEYRLKYEEAHNYYIRAKQLLKAILDSFQDNDEAAEKYGIMHDTPRNVDALYRKIEQWKDQHDIYVAEGDERVIADALVTDMMTLADEFYTGWKFAIEQKREAAEAYDAKQAEFKLGTKYLSVIYSLAVMVWGDEDPRLVELGFQTRSGIHTPGDPDPTLPEWMEPIETYLLRYLAPVDMVQHTYSSCQEAETCRIEIRPQGATEWELVIEGLTMIPEDIIPYRSPSPGPGIWEYRITPINAAGEYGEPKIATVEIP